MGGQTDKWADGRMGGRTDRRTDGWADGRMGGRTDGRTDGRMGGRTDGRTDGWADGRTDGDHNIGNYHYNILRDRLHGRVVLQSELNSGTGVILILKM